MPAIFKQPTRIHGARLLLIWLLVGCQPIAAPPAAGGGQLAYIGGDGNVYITSADRQSKTAITQDATTATEGRGRSYHRVAWSPDGWLAFAAVERAQDVMRSELFVAAPNFHQAQMVGSSEDNFVIYLYWSPVPCATSHACHRLAYLIGNNTDITLRLVEVNGEGTSNREIGAGRPLYFSWAAQGEQLLWHAGGARRSDPTAQLALYRVADGQVQLLPYPPGYFVAPAWSPTDDAWLAVIETTRGMALRYVDANSAGKTLLQTPNEITFVWSPDGQRIAYAARFYGADPFYGPIYVYDVATGKSRRLTDVGLHVQAFFWSPDGARIGYLNWLALPNESWAQWRTYELATGQDRGFNAFNPSFSMRMMIGSFNQYAQSERLWSPDGRYLTYADRDRTLVERVWLVDTLAAKGAPPLLVDEGSLGVWSWQ
ncbi:MAG: hypothetical protein M3Q45_03355 [Chloroflexota bacterium]|nr:hypothetical protein [Chloroflexota bacterium]